MTDIKNMKGILATFIVLILPLILLIAGMIISLHNIWYYLLTISWFGLGLIFSVATE